jgi:hypothetical protein
MEDRVVIGLGDGTTERETIDSIVIQQLPGGLFLATTKVLIAVNHPIIRGSKDFSDAFNKTGNVLGEMEAAPGIKYEDSAHDFCGAEGSVQGSVENEIEDEYLLSSVGLFVPRNDYTDSIVHGIRQNKRNALQEGLYSGFNSDDRKAFIMDKWPRNYQHIAVRNEDQDTHGHDASAVYFVTQPGKGFIKNGKAFCITTPTWDTLANQLGGSDEERLAIKLAFIDDACHVSAGLAKPNMPAFAQQ